MKTVIMVLLILFPVFVINSQEQESTNFFYETPTEQQFIIQTYFNYIFGDAKVNIYVIHRNEKIVAISLRDANDNTHIGLFELKNLSNSLRDNRVELMNINPIILNKINKLMQIYISPYFSVTKGGAIHINFKDGDPMVLYLYKPIHASFDHFKLYERVKEDNESDAMYKESQISKIEVELNVFLSIKDKKIE